LLDIFGSEGKEEAIAAQVFYPITELGKRQTMADAKFIPAPVTKIITINIKLVQSTACPK